MQKTNDPWDGDGTLSIIVTPAKPTDFTLCLRVPGWSRSTQVVIHGQPVSGATPAGYLDLRRRWSSGDTITVIEANPRVLEDFGRVTVQRGPLVCCPEQPDQPDGVPLFHVPQFHEEFPNDMLDAGGNRGAETSGWTRGESASHGAVWRRHTADAPRGRQVELKFVPYYAWANRAATPIEVWTPILKA